MQNKTVCEKNMCNGCMACVNACQHSAISICDDIDFYNAYIDLSLCVDCGRCTNVCPNNSPVCKNSPILWRQGWSCDDEIRRSGSSGGVATALAKAFVNGGGIVCSCTYSNGEFVFDFADNEDDVCKFTGSKYVKSNPSDAFLAIRKYVKQKKDVLFIGLPCQVAGLKSFVGESDNLYTVDLICHGTPSPRLLEIFLEQRGRTPNKINTIAFREKAQWFMSCDGESVAPPSVIDEYMLCFLNGISYTQNCYKCDYAQVKRVSDITLGDSWGSEMTEEEQKSGISLILCCTDKGKRLLEMSDLCLFDVDAETAIENNKQLSRASEKNERRDKFFRSLKKNGNFGRTVRRVFPYEYFRIKFKSFLVRIGVLNKKSSQKEKK